MRCGQRMLLASDASKWRLTADEQLCLPMQCVVYMRGVVSVLVGFDDMTLIAKK